jgi:RNA polymerase sigma-70 factor (ECF subfamily)
MGGITELRGATAVAETFKGRAQAAKPALIDGALGVAVAFGGVLRILLVLEMEEGRISAINALADPERIGAFAVEML